MSSGEHRGKLVITWKDPVMHACGEEVDSMVFSQWIFPMWHGGDQDHDLQNPHRTCKACTCDVCEENLCVTLAIFFFLRIA